MTLSKKQASRAVRTVILKKRRKSELVELHINALERIDALEVQLKKRQETEERRLAQVNLHKQQASKLLMRLHEENKELRDSYNSACTNLGRTVMSLGGRIISQSYLDELLDQAKRPDF